MSRAIRRSDATETRFAVLLASHPQRDTRALLTTLFGSVVAHLGAVALVLWLSQALRPPNPPFGSSIHQLILQSDRWSAPVAVPVLKNGSAPRSSTSSRWRTGAVSYKQTLSLPVPNVPDLAAPLVAQFRSAAIEEAIGELAAAANRYWEGAGFGARGRPSTIEALKAGPSLTPYNLAPELLNRSEIVRLLNANYPRMLRNAGIGGLTMLWLLIDENGKARKAVLRTSSGRDALDAVALGVVPSMRFSAAKNNGVKTPVWVQLPVRFRIDELTGAPFD